jgi:glycerol-3-phosphate acyltransferase PlsY
VRQLFKNKISKFGSLISLIALTGMLTLFSLAIPEFLISATGRIFAIVWAVTAIVIFIAHANNIKPQRRRYLMSPIAGKKDARTCKNVRQERIIRG